MNGFLPWAWASVTLLCAGAGPDLPWWVSPALIAVAICAAMASRWSAGRPLAAGLLALGAAPLWSATAVEGGAKGAIVLVFGAAMLAAVRLGAGAGGLPAAVAWVVAGAAGIEGARLVVVASEVPGASGLAVLVLSAGLAAAGAAAGARPVRLASAGLALSAVVLGVRAGILATEAPTTPEQVVGSVRSRVATRHLAPIAADPHLGLAALGADPAWHAVAQAMLPSQGPGRLLDAGWSPVGAPLVAEDRLATAAALDARGRGGEALRLLWRGRDRPQVAWQALLLAREQGEADIARQLTRSAHEPPGSVPRLPGRVPLELTFYVDGRVVIDIQADRPIDRLWLGLSGTWMEGAPTLSVGVDGAFARRFEVPEAPTRVVVWGALEPGPHRLVLQYDNDRVSIDGDRNILVSEMGAEG